MNGLGMWFKWHRPWVQFSVLKESKKERKKEGYREG
jgi:hypothetical protein